MTPEQEQMAAVFNEWLRRYKDSPSEFREVLNSDGKPVADYGEQCTIYFEQIAAELKASMREQRLQELAKRYHQETDAYDRTVCSGPILNGAILPSNAYETSLIGEHAREVRARILSEASEEGFTTTEIDIAIRQNC